MHWVLNACIIQSSVYDKSIDTVKCIGSPYMVVSSTFVCRNDLHDDEMMY